AMAIVFCRTSVHSFWTRLVAGAWLASIVLLTWPPARAAGDLLWMSLLVGGVLVWISRATVAGHEQAARYAAHG
ncbi:MAG TPA: hypothetical protein VG713_18410, partial [Pirellulales bacterium]|nr:hypothetical protein [Pirellulales bacterium]